LFGGDIERDVPLFVKHETRDVWPILKDLIGGTETLAVIALNGYFADQLGLWVSYSRRREYYSNRDCHPLLTYARVLAAIEFLESLGLIVHRRQSPGQRGWQSSFASTPELNAIVETAISGRRLPLLMPRRSVILRDAKRNSLDPGYSRPVKRMERELAPINETITSSTILAEGLDLRAPLVRIFNVASDFSRCGRSFGRGTSWQNVEKKVRNSLHIDGEETVELDFRNLHVAMLYCEEGLTPPADSYEIGYWDRRLVKAALFRLLNGANENKVRFGIATEVLKGRVDPGQEFSEAARLIADIKAAHRSIAHHFFTDVGSRLMRRDSDLAINIMGALVGKGITSLPVHDSFIVQQRNRDVLLAEMHEQSTIMGYDLEVTDA